MAHVCHVSSLPPVPRPHALPCTGDVKAVLKAAAQAGVQNGSGRWGSGTPPFGRLLVYPGKEGFAREEKTSLTDTPPRLYL